MSHINKRQEKQMVVSHGSVIKLSDMEARTFALESWLCCLTGCVHLGS